MSGQISFKRKKMRGRNLLTATAERQFVPFLTQTHCDFLKIISQTMILKRLRRGMLTEFRPLMQQQTKISFHSRATQTMLEMSLTW